jgi:hypothetical protein
MPCYCQTLCRLRCKLLSIYVQSSVRAIRQLPLILSRHTAQNFSLLFSNVLPLSIFIILSPIYILCHLLFGNRRPSHRGIFLNLLSNIPLPGGFFSPLLSSHSLGVCAILLRLYTSTERLKRVYRSPEPLLDIDYFTYVMVLIIIYNFYVYSFYLKLT